MKAIRLTIYQFFYPEMSNRILPLFRVVFALLLLIEGFSLFPQYRELFGTDGFLNAQLMDFLNGNALPTLNRFNFLLGLKYNDLLSVIYYGHLAFTLLLLFGIQTRWVTIVGFVFYTFLMNSSYVSIYGVDRYFHLVYFLMIFSPWGEKVTSDLTEGEKESVSSREHGFWIRILQIAVALTYANAGWAKAMGSDWWTGDAIWRAVNLPDFNQVNLMWLIEFPSLIKLLCWGTVIIEATFLVVLFSKKLRWFAVFSMICMHVGIMCFMGLWLFGLTMIVFDFCLFLLPDIATEENRV